MSESIKEYFANMYPQSPRTPVNNIIKNEGPSNLFELRPKYVEKKDASKLTTGKKILIILLIAILGAIAFSAQAYTQSDNIFGTMGLDLFDQQYGDPGFIVIGIHTLVFAAIIWIVLKATSLL